MFCSLVAYSHFATNSSHERKIFTCLQAGREIDNVLAHEVLLRANLEFKFFRLKQRELFFRVFNTAVNNECQVPIIQFTI
jgi:hypothetical protein